MAAQEQLSPSGAADGRGRPCFAATRVTCVPSMAEVVALTGGPRRILGLTDPPGAGKSTVAADLADALRMAAAPVPMDGFHRRGGPGRIRHRTVSHGVLFPMSCTSATAAAVDEPAAPQAMFIDEGAG